MGLHEARTLFCSPLCWIRSPQCLAQSKPSVNTVGCINEWKKWTSEGSALAGCCNHVKILSHSRHWKAGTPFRWIYQGHSPAELGHLIRWGPFPGYHGKQAFISGRRLFLPTLWSQNSITATSRSLLGKSAPVPESHQLPWIGFRVHDYWA